MRVFLVDNGSLRLEAWVNLCGVARALGGRLGRLVEPASVLHSSRIDPSEVPAEWPRPTTWERATREALEAGERQFVVLPFFFGPTGAIVDYLPERRARLEERFGAFSLRIAPFLAEPLEVENGGGGLVRILAEQVRTLVAERGLHRPEVILVDHGSPRPEVTAVRDRMGTALALALRTEVASVRVASMERRPDPRYAFNEPLLARALREPSLPAGDVVVAMLFLSPGRHAGEGGDIAGICAEAEHARPGLRVHRTALVGEHPGIVDLLEARWRIVAAGD